MNNLNVQMLKTGLFSILLISLSACSMGIFASDESGEEKVAANASGGEISVLWRSNIDYRLPASNFGISIPAVVRGSEGELIVAGAQDGRVRILSAEGSEMDRIAIGSAGESGGLQLPNGLVVVGDVDGHLYGIDADKAEVVWRVELSSALMSRPVPVGGDFIILTENNQVFRFSSDGKKIWSYTGTLGGLGMQLMPSPVVYRGQVYLAMRNGDVVALKASSGSFLWQRQLLLSSSAAVLSELKVPVATPVVIPSEQSGRHEDMLAVSLFQGDLFFLSLRDGSTLMNRAISMKSSPLLIGKHLYIADVSGSVSMLNAAGGETLWKQSVSDVALAGPILWNEMLWLADATGRVYRMNLEGKLLGSIQLNGRFDLAPVATSDGVLVRNNLGTLYKLR